MGKTAWAVALAALWWGAAMAHAVAHDALPPIPERAPEEGFQAVPAPWRDYYLQAREAERIDDRLARCLAYPDLPDNDWPAGHAEAHCRFHMLQPLSLATFADQLDRGEGQALDELLDGLLAKHYSVDGGEDIHVAIEAFDASEEAGRLSERWLQLAPRSPYAHIARANHYRAAAWKARGDRWAEETPREQLRRMSALVAQAVPLFRKAIALEPRLMPAYVGMLDVAMLDSQLATEREAYQGAMAQDPACLEFARQRMQSLTPRWGGGYEDMLSFGVQLSGHVARRPQLAIHIAAPYGDRGDRLMKDGEFTRDTVEVFDIALRIGSNESHLRDAANVILNLPESDGGPERWRGVALLLQEQRFNTTNAWAHRQIAWQLLHDEPEWALRHALLAVELEPDDAWGRFMAGSAYYVTRQAEKAEPHFLVAARDSTQRRPSLLSLGSLWMFDAGLEARAAATRAKPYVDQLLSEYPQDGRGWLLRISVASVLDGVVDPEMARTFLAYADRSDPLQAEVAASMEAAGLVAPAGERP